MAFVLAMIAVPFLAVWSMLAPSLWKSEIGRVTLADRTRVHVGSWHDGDVGCDYLVKVCGKNRKPEEWTHFAGGAIPEGYCQTAVTGDGRFAGIAVRRRGTGDGLAMVIYDVQADELWWRAESQWRSNGKFVRPWRDLGAVNPQLPEAPY
jgi:hypothetical protein